MRLRGTSQTRVYVRPHVTFSLLLRGSLLAEGGGVPEGERGDSPGKWHRKGEEGWEMSADITSFPAGRAFIDQIALPL